MVPTSEAEEHLRTIRSLMERATIYRSISVQAALLGGLLACVAGGFLQGAHDPFVQSLSKTAPAPNADLFGFQLKWLFVLVLSGALNLFFLYRHAQQRGEVFVSAGMRAALRTMVPPLLCGAVFTSLASKEGLPPAWMLFYGLALLSTAHFAPGSLVRLGWAFMLSGLLFLLVDGRLLLGMALSPAKAGAPPSWNYADLLMASTFGIYHLIYAACAYLRKPAAAPTARA